MNAMAVAQDPVASDDIGMINPEAAAHAFPKRGFSPYAGRNYPTRVFWGDQHVHTGWSVDAGAFGATLGPEEALRFARGEQVTSSLGEPARLSRPLDWAAVTDHSDAAGVIFEIRDGNPNLMIDPLAKRWHDMMASGQGVQAASEMIAAQSNNKVPPVMKDPRLAMSIWAKNTAIMEKYNEPGRFTAFIGYEWTSNAGGGDNLHRNVIYRDGKDKADDMLPMTTFDSENPEDLWKWMSKWEERTGGSLLAIPHNGNLSNGKMFALSTFEGNPLTRDWAETRARWEPMYEITQIKGDGETHPSLSPSDEFANFEKWDAANLAGVPKQPGMLEHEYARQALAEGLKLEASLGANPFKFGFVSGTDTHTGLATAEEDNFFGKHTGVEPSPHRWEHDVIKTPQVTIKGWQTAAAGYTGVWATENTREAIWDALKRKEAYSTTGPRMLVRFFGGWDFVPADAQTRMPADAGYAKGVPMGGDLLTAPAGKSPTFLAAAMKDPLSGNLDRIQIIKAWADADGKLQESVHDVAWSDGRKPGADGKLPPVGNTVDVANATWTNTIGSPELIAVWKDPDFDPKLRAVYYVRVIEIPTPRWTAYDQKRFGIKMSDNVPMSVQERAYTSPIWYTP
ncbi:MAG: DUF3604 domain-containing protein [Aestuariivirga sp.]|uniref:DUF3604 domain-containing protein n=1 Tax=Aestuariivirga sp. TaxID=2650926 RepID=UPI003019783D